MIQITTNGSLLDPQIINELSLLQSLELIISVNSISAKGRRMLMGDPEPGKIRLLFELLTARQFSFHGSIVAMPHLIGFEDLRQTILFLDQCGAKSIRLLIPGFTRLTDQNLIPDEEVISKCYQLIAELQRKISTPLLPEPPLIEDLLPVMAGVGRGSVAEIAGLRSGDLILTVNGQEPFSRVEAYDLLTKSVNPFVRVKRDQQILTKNMLKAASENCGIALSYDLDPRQVEQVRINMDRQGKTLMLLSLPALKGWQIASCRRLALRHLSLQPVRPGWFGGTINCAGLLTIGDFQETLDGVDDLQAYRKILLPAVAFDRSGRDLRGFHYLTLNTRGIPSQLID
jgi:hypothetical protein